MFVRLLICMLSLRSSRAGLAAAWTTNPRPKRSTGCGPSSLGGRCADGEMKHREVLYVWALVPLGLVRTSVGLRSQKLDLLCSEAELSHLWWMRQWAPRTVLCSLSNKPCHSCSQLPMHGSPKCFPCDSVEAPYFYWQQRYVFSSAFQSYL